MNKSEKTTLAYARYAGLVLGLAVAAAPSTFAQTANTTGIAAVDTVARPLSPPRIAAGPPSPGTAPIRRAIPPPRVTMVPVTPGPAVVRRPLGVTPPSAEGSTIRSGGVLSTGLSR